MDLYFSPLACSMATRIALYEAGSQANFIEVDPKTKRVLKDNSDFYAVNPLGLVPVVRTDDGVTLTENAAILQHVAERLPDSSIGAKPGIERSKLQQWLCFIGTELHKGLFTPLLGKTVPAEVKAYTLERYLSRLDYLNKYHEGARIRARPFQRGGRLSHHRAELEHRHPDDRFQQISGGEGLSRADEEAAERGESAGRGVRAVPGRNRAAQGGGVNARSHHAVVPANADQRISSARSHSAEPGKPTLMSLRQQPRLHIHHRLPEHF